MPYSLEIGLKYTSQVVVDINNTAMTMGSGDMEVYATPGMIALMENSAMSLIAPYLPENYTTVGSFIEAKHIRPSKIGEEIFASSELINIENQKLTFRIKAHLKDGTIIGESTHIRYIVEREKFLSKI